MIRKCINGLDLLFFNNLIVYDEIVHFVTTRNRYMKNGKLIDFNLGFSGETPCKKVIMNRSRLFSCFKKVPSCWIELKQEHSDRVVTLSLRDLNELFTPPEAEPGKDFTLVKSKEDLQHFSNANLGVMIADGIITDLRDVFIGVLVADCVPLLFYEPDRKVIAAVHAGWKGTLKRIVEKTVLLMVNNFGADTGRIFVGIGPSISSCCYEVGIDVFSAFEKDPIYTEDILTIRNKKLYLDLVKANIVQLIKAGIDRRHIEISGYCTCCKSDMFYSYRRAGSNAGRFGSFIMLA